MDKLIDTEKHISLFYLKWILFVEKATKLAISKALKLINQSSQWLILKLDNTQSTKKIIKNALDGIKEKTWLLPISDFVDFVQKVTIQMMSMFRVHQLNCYFHQSLWENYLTF